MDAISSVNNPTLALIQASIEKNGTLDQTALAVAAKAQEIQNQQGAAAISLIEASGHSLVDVRA
jgi:hypothetical protein